jgi:hypothetical protein
MIPAVIMTLPITDSATPRPARPSAIDAVNVPFFAIHSPIAPILHPPGLRTGVCSR